MTRWKAQREVMLTGRIGIPAGDIIDVIGECVEDLTGADQYKIQYDGKKLRVYKSFVHRYFYQLKKVRLN
jgi:hypothetical protein